MIGLDIALLRLSRDKPCSVIKPEQQRHLAEGRLPPNARSLQPICTQPETCCESRMILLRQVVQKPPDLRANQRNTFAYL
jgi:hypothetical protein